MSTATMTPKRKTNAGKPVSEYSMKAWYIKPVMKGEKQVMEWTYRGDTYLTKSKNLRLPYVTEFEALVHQLALDNNNIWRLDIYNNTLPHIGGENLLYSRLHDVITPGKNLDGHMKASLKKFHLL